MGDGGDPPTDGFREPDVIGREEISLQRGEHEHAAPRTGHHERHAELRADGETLLHAPEFLVVLVEVAGQECLASSVDIDHAAPLLTENVETGLRAGGHRAIAGAHGDQRIACLV